MTLALTAALIWLGLTAVLARLGYVLARRRQRQTLHKPR